MRVSMGEYLSRLKVKNIAFSGLTPIFLESRSSETCLEILVDIKHFIEIFGFFFLFGYFQAKYDQVTPPRHRKVVA